MFERLNYQDKKYLEVLIKQEAASMLVDLIQQVLDYNASSIHDDRNMHPDREPEEVHYRTLELLERYARERYSSDNAWIEMHEAENDLQR